MKMKLDEFSAKVADGLPDEDAEDIAGDRWAGVVPLHTVQGSPETDPRVRTGIQVPDFVKEFKFAGVKS